MKVKIEMDESLEDIEVVIKTPVMNERVQQVQATLFDFSKKQAVIVFYKGSVEYYLSLNDILFFETDEKNVRAHTCDDLYQVKYKKSLFAQ